MSASMAARVHTLESGTPRNPRAQVMFKGANFAAISGDVAFLAAFTVVMLLLAGATFKRSL